MINLSQEEFEAASRRGDEVPDDKLARSVHYDASTRTVHVGSRDGASFSFPVDEAQGLADASDRDLAEVEILGDGYGLRWEKLDVDFTVGGLAAGIFGTAKYMAQTARRAENATPVAANGTARLRPRKAAG